MFNENILEMCDGQVFRGVRLEHLALIKQGSHTLGSHFHPQSIHQVPHPNNLSTLITNVLVDFNSTMSVVNITNIQVLDNPTRLGNPFQFEITFECIAALQHGIREI